MEETSFDAEYNIANAYILKLEYDSAYFYFLKAQDLKKTDYLTLLALADLDYKFGKLETSKSWLHKINGASQLSKIQTIAIDTRLYKIDIKLGDTVGAIKCIDSILNYDKDDIEARTMRVFLLSESNLRPSDLLSDLNILIEKAKNDKQKAIWYLMKGRFYQKSVNLSIAMSEVDSAIKLDPQNQSIIVFKAVYLFTDFESSDKELTRACQIDTSNLEIRALRFKFRLKYHRIDLALPDGDALVKLGFPFKPEEVRAIRNRETDELNNMGENFRFEFSNSIVFNVIN